MPTFCSNDCKSFIQKMGIFKINSISPMVKLLSFSISCCLLLVISGCRKEEIENQPPEVEVTSDFYFDGEIDGKRIVFQDAVDNFALAASSGCTVVSGCGCCTSNQYAGLSTSEKYQETDGEVKLRLIQVQFSHSFGYEPAGNDIDGMFEVGKYPYQEKDGIIFRYLDSNGQLWGSDAGENNSVFFEINEVSKEVIAYNEYFQLHKIISATINCTLYPLNNNLTLPKPKEKIELKNGVVRLRASLH